MRNLKARAPQPVLPPKNKALRTVAPGQEEEAVVYGPAKLRADVLAHTKVFCALHKQQMQDYLSDVVEEHLRAVGYLPPVATAPDHE
jgi:hypothetical protein